MRFSWYSIVYQTVVRGTGFQKKRRDHLEVSIIFKIGAVGILVSVLSQILKHSGREEQAFLVSFSGLLLVLFWIVAYIYELFKNIQQLFLFQYHKKGDCAKIPAHSPPKAPLPLTTVCETLLQQKMFFLQASHLPWTAGW